MEGRERQVLLEKLYVGALNGGIWPMRNVRIEYLDGYLRWEIKSVSYLVRNTLLGIASLLRAQPNPQDARRILCP